MIEELWDRKILKVRGPHAPKTVSRRLANWSTLHQWKGVEPPFDHPGIKKALRLAMKASGRAPQRKSRKPVTRDVLERLLATCSGSKAIDLRDRAILLVAFAAGGRRRSEVATLRHSQISVADPIKLRPSRSGIANGALCSHCTRPDENHHGRAGRLRVRRGTGGCGPARVDAVCRNHVGADLPRGPQGWLYRRNPLTPQSVNLILKKRCRMAGLDPAEFSAHGLRSGFMTQAGRDGIPLVDAMRQSAHKSVQQAAGYYDEQEHAQSRSVQIFI